MMMNKNKLQEPPMQYDVWLVSLDPTIGKEIKKTRPCVIISPNEISALSTVIVAPLTSKGFDFPVRVKSRFQSKDGLILLDQIRSVDKQRLVKKLGILDKKIARKVSETLVEMFIYE
jgi:mRNA interferase MazF